MMHDVADCDLMENEVDTDEDLSGIPEIEETETNELTGIIATPNNGPLNLRVNPDKKAAVLVSIPAGTKVSYKEFSYEWAIVRYDGHEGYCMKKFIK